jgi:hypothetical protein
VVGDVPPVVAFVLLEQRLILGEPGDAGA